MHFPGISVKTTNYGGPLTRCKNFANSPGHERILIVHQRILVFIKFHKKKIYDDGPDMIKVQNKDKNFVAYIQKPQKECGAH